MSGFLDTSAVVRYIFGDLEGLAQAATDIVDGEQELWITDVVQAEASYVLSSVYQLSRALIVDQLIEFVQKQNIIVYAISKGLLIQALLMCRPSCRVSVADALIWVPRVVVDQEWSIPSTSGFPMKGWKCGVRPPDHDSDSVSGQPSADGLEHSSVNHYAGSGYKSSAVGR